MNLRQQTSNAEKKTEAKTWYHQPETLLPVQAVEPKPQTVPFPTLFEPSVAERILARAGALQEVHGQMLTQKQIEAVAHEIGITPEFVRLAIEQDAQEKNGAVAETLPAVQHRYRNLTKQQADVWLKRVNSSIEQATAVTWILLLMIPFSIVMLLNSGEEDRSVYTTCAVFSLGTVLLLRLWMIPLQKRNRRHFLRLRGEE